MIDKELREVLPEDALVFDNPSYDNSIIGITHDDRVIYDYEKMIEELMNDEEMEYDEATDFISYNTIRSLSYVADEQKPIVMFPVIK